MGPQHPLYQNTAPRTPHCPTSYSGNIRIQRKHLLSSLLRLISPASAGSDVQLSFVTPPKGQLSSKPQWVTGISVRLSGTRHQPGLCGEQELQGMLLILPRHVSHPISEHTLSVCAALCRHRIRQSCTLTHFIHSYYLYYRFTHTLLIALRNRTYSSSWHGSQRKEGKKKSLAVTNLTRVESNSICGRS